jgi:hypothetical protein
VPPPDAPVGHCPIRALAAFAFRYMVIGIRPRAATAASICVLSKVQ